MGVSESSRGVNLFDLDAADLGRLRQVLADHGFLGDAVREAVGSHIGPAHLRKDLPLYLRRLAAKTPLHTAIKLFCLGQWVEERAGAEAVAPLALDRLVAAGLLEAGPRGVRCPFEIGVHRDLLLAHDRFEPERGPELAPDHVLGTNNPARLLDALTVRLPVAATLDLGCGGGVQSFLAGRHSERVFAVDKNPRALAFLHVNASLNGVTNVETLEGDLFAPVAGRRFGLLVCNPPYVISPDSRHVFMESGRPQDGICEEVVRQAGDHLEDGAFATILCNWALRKDEEWSAPLRRWVEGNGCDAWLLRGELQDPLSYAAVWNRDRNPATYEATLDRWLAYYRECGIEAIAMGAVILRRRAGGANWVRADVLSQDPDVSCHEHILRIFAAEDFLAATPADRDLLGVPFRLVEAHHLRQSLRLRGGKWSIEKTQIQLADGFGFEGAVDAGSLLLLQRCDGRTPVGQAVEELARTAAADRERLSTAVASTVRRLVALGFLVPPGGGPAEPADS